MGYCWAREIPKPRGCFL